MASRAGEPARGVRSSTSCIALGLVLALAQAAALLWLDLYPAPRALWGDEVMYWDTAQKWAANQPATLDLMWPPLYPRLLSAILRVGGSRMAIQLFQLALTGGSAWLLFDLVRRLLGTPIALGASALFLLDPQLVAFSVYFWPETVHLFLALAAAWIVVARPNGWMWSVVLGVALGLALLTKNLLAPMLPIAAAAWVAMTRWQGLLSLGIAVGALAAVVTPTIIDNGGQYGAHVIGDSARFNLWVGLNDVERRNLVNEVVGVEFERYRESAATHAGRNRVLDVKIRAFVEERGLWRITRAQLGRQYFRLFDKDSFFTDQLPGGGIESPGFGYRSLHGWQVSALRTWAYAIHAVVLTAAPFGALIVWRRHRLVAMVLLGYIALTLVIFLFAHVKTRYRVQFLPAFYIFAAAALLARSRDWRSERALGVRAALPVWLAGTCSALLLLLGFGRTWLS